MVLPNLEDLSFIRRIVLTVVVVVFSLLLIWLIEMASAQPLVIMLPPSKWDAEIIEMDKQALREAYIAKAKQLFDVFVREGRENPERPMKGAAEARRAFVEIMKAIEFREQKLKEQ